MVVGLTLRTGRGGGLVYVGDCQCALLVFAEFDEEQTPYCCLPTQVLFKEFGQPEEQNICYFKKNYRNTECCLKETEILSASGSRFPLHVWFGC